MIVEQMKLKEIAVVTDSLHQTPNYVSDGIPMVRVTDVKPGYLSLDHCFMVSEKDFFRFSANHVPRRGDIVISRVGSYGNFAFVASDELFCLGQNTAIITPLINPEYLYYFLSSALAKTQIESLVVGSTQKTISLKSIKELSIPVFDDLTQKRIAEILSVLDRKMNCNNAINQNLAEQVHTVFAHLFKDNESVTPATVADIALNVTDGVHNTVHDDPDGEYLLLSCKNIKGGSLSIGSSERKINKETFEKLRRRTKLDKGDVLISSVGTVGELLLLNTEPSNYEFQRSVAIVKPNPEVVSPAYLYESLVCQKAELINAAHGAVQQCLFISDIAGFPIGIPSQEDLHKFDELVTPMFDEITANEAESIRLASLRDALLPKLMSGELDVSELEL